MDTDCNEIYGRCFELRFTAVEFSSVVSEGKVKHLKKVSMNVFCHTDHPSLQISLSIIFEVISGIEHLSLSCSTTMWLYGRWRLHDLPFGSYSNLRPRTNFIDFVLSKLKYK
ncbi:hypothetical protein TSUD_248560 [Trifolium subterraneum]|uniref:Uncharacterized protein n=1 Tax=Trifolium subterraneum TaxID=3900 RepID=A0A2Z6MPF8_TRISU|nr:hypothetical protein TSUD_248560 [Trifolium subterraneum]